MALVVLRAGTDEVSVRRAISPTMTAQQLPDAVVDEDAYFGSADRWARARLPEGVAWGDLDADQQQALRTAAVLYAASLLVPVLPMMLRERFVAYEYQRVAADPAALAADLRGRAEQEAAAVVDPLVPGALGVVPVAEFTLANGSRGRLL